MMLTPSEKFQNQLKEEIIDNRLAVSGFIHMMVGDLIGEGETRTVYDCALSPALVIKHEPNQTMHNVLEWEIYKDLEGNKNKLKKWLAEPVMLSPCGRWLIMEKTSPPPPSFIYPKKMPKALRDFHNENFGLIDGKFVCHDYGSIPLITDPESNKRVKVKWRRYSGEV